MAEWFNALVLKTSEGESPPRVRISPPPPINTQPPEELGVKIVKFCFSLDLSLDLQKRIVSFDKLCNLFVVTS